VPQQLPGPIGPDEAAALRGEVRALSAAIDRLATKLKRDAAPQGTPPTLRGYANENTGAITLLALVVAIDFGIASGMNGVSADLRQAGRWLLLLTTAAALITGLELVGEGLRAASMAWDAVADQGLERRPKVVTVAAAVRLTILVGLMTIVVIAVGLFGLTLDTPFSVGLVRYYAALSVFLLLPELLGRWIAWRKVPQHRPARLAGTLAIFASVLLISWLLIKP